MTAESNTEAPSLAVAVNAIRTRVALSDDPDTLWLAISGPGARNYVERVVPMRLALSDAQLKPTLLLDHQAHVLGDMTVGRDDARYLFSIEALSPRDALALLRKEAASFDVQLELTAAGARVRDAIDEPVTGASVSVHGPWAWELLAEISGPDILSMPYLSLFRDELTVYRIGKTGEYGYHLVGPTEQVASAKNALTKAGRRYELLHVGQDALDVCALENGFFVVRSEGRRGLSPIELQMQWRISYQGMHLSQDALVGLRERNARRIVTFVAERPTAVGERVRCQDEVIGEVVAAALSPTLGRPIGLAVLALPYAYAGIDAFSIDTVDGAVAIRTVSPPLIENRSLHVRAQRHSFFGTEEASFPSLVAPTALRGAT